MVLAGISILEPPTLEIYTPPRVKPHIILCHSLRTSPFGTAPDRALLLLPGNSSAEKKRSEGHF